MSICKSKTAHGSMLNAHSKKENYEKDITTYIRTDILDDCNGTEHHQSHR